MRWIALLIIFTTFSGCLTDGPSERPMSVHEAWDRADAVAQGLQAQVASLSAIEFDNPAIRDFVREETRDDVSRAMFDVFDPAPGDGLAPRWGALLIAPDSMYLLVVGADGKVAMEGPVGYPQDLDVEFEPLPRPAMDSDDLANTFDNATWIGIKARGDSLGVIDYIGGLGYASYQITVDGTFQTDDDVASFTYYVDPDNGTVLGLDVMPGTEFGAEIGRVDLTAQLGQPDSGSFTLQDDHERIAMRLGMRGGFNSNPADRTAPGHDLKAVVTDPMGGEHTIEWRTPPLPFGQGSASDAIVVPAMAGEWQVTLSVEQGVRSGASLQFCTTGERDDMGSGFGGNVCDALG